MHTDTSKLTNEQSTPQIYHGTAIVLSDPKKKKKKKKSMQQNQRDRLSLFMRSLTAPSKRFYTTSDMQQLFPRPVNGFRCV